MHLYPISMAGPQDGDDTELLTKVKPKTKRPPMYKVMLLNDDFTPMEFVVHVLERFFGINHAQAVEICWSFIKKGWLLWVCSATRLRRQKWRKSWTLPAVTSTRCNALWKKKNSR